MSERKRRRPAVSCTVCRRRKVRCNREQPCSNCIRSRNETCIYEDNLDPQPLPRNGAQHQAATSDPASIVSEKSYRNPVEIASSTSGASTRITRPSTLSGSIVSSPASQTSTQEVDSINSRIKRLEEQLSKAITNAGPQSEPATVSSIQTTSSGIAGTFHVHHENTSLSLSKFMGRTVMHKNRLFGQSHWIHGITLFLDILEAIEPHIRSDTWKAGVGIQRCKSLARVVKSQRAPPWPLNPNSDLPSKEIVSELVDCYLRTTESVYRVLHIPSFRRELEEIWNPTAVPDIGFVMQVKLVLAIGSATYDKQFSMRTAAIRWVYEAQTWLLHPEFKTQLNFQSLQTQVLLLLAREAASVGEDLIWITAGSLLRTAIHLGLHRDPARLPKKTPFAAEMSRRLWNTILEICLQSSMNCGGPPLISLDDFDTEPPRNIDDNDLAAEDLVPRAESELTNMSVVIALRKTFATRLAIAKLLNDVHASVTYEETLRLDAELRVVYKTLRRNIQQYNLNFEFAQSHFQMCAIHFIMNRYFSALHVPFFGRGLRESTFAFSRQVVVETSLKLWCTAYPSSSITAVQSCGETISSGASDFARFTTYGSGFFRAVAIQSCFLIAAELKAELQESENIGPIPLRSDLLTVLTEGKAWTLQCINAGETNIKGYLAMCMFAAQIDALKKSLSAENTAHLLLKTAEEAGDTCLAILQSKAGLYGTEEDLSGMDDINFNASPGLLGEWDFLMPDAFCDFDGGKVGSDFFAPFPC